MSFEIAFYIGVAVVAGVPLVQLIRLRKAYQADLMSRNQKLEVLQEKVAHLDQNLAEVNVENAKLEEKVKWLMAEKSGEQQRFETLASRISSGFEKVANDIYDKKSNALKDDHSRHLEAVLNPLRQNLTQFQEQVQKVHTLDVKERHSLKEELHRMQQATASMQNEAQELTKALKGDVKSQGLWGELILERVLEASGLRPEEEYTLQGKGLGLKDIEGKHQKPDAIINLPGNKHIVVDSKVTLEPYRNLVSDTENTQASKQFLQSIKDHIQGLGKKQYHANDKLVTPEFVFLFFPVEGALSKALELDASLFKFAWERSVVIVTPGTLIASLKTIASLWRLDRQNKNAVEIAKEAGLLYDKFALFLRDIEQLGTGISKVSDTYQEVLKKLTLGRGNLISKTEKLKQMGAKANKQLPKGFQELIEGETGL